MIPLRDALKIFTVEEHELSKPWVKKKYKELARRFHPDVGGSTEAFLRLREAYELLHAYAPEKREPSSPSWVKRVFVKPELVSKDTLFYVFRNYLVNHIGCFISAEEIYDLDITQRHKAVLTSWIDVAFNLGYIEHDWYVHYCPKDLTRRRFEIAAGVRSGGLRREDIEKLERYGIL